MNKTKLILLLTTLIAAPAAAAPVITLPDTGVYYYWFLSSSGTVEHSLVSATATGKIDAAKELSSGGTLYILDPHSGGIAGVPLSASTKNTALAVNEFKVPDTASAPAAAAPATAAAPAVAAHPTPPPVDAGSSLLSGVMRTIIALVVLGAVFWFFRKLFLTKGQPLIDIARKVGVDVPNPEDLPKTEIEHDGKYEPPPVVRVQPIPEAATRPAKQSAGAGFLTTDDGVSYGIGNKALSIGRVDGNDIVLQDESVSRRHAHIEPLGDAAELVDENSANGVFVNGQKITRQILAQGDRVNIGRVSLRYEK